MNSAIAISNILQRRSGAESAQQLAAAFASRVESDGGVTEAQACLIERITLLKNLGLWDKASAVWLPHGYKESKLYAAKGGANADLTLTRAGTRIRKGPTYVAQVPYNLLQQSNSFDTSPWSSLGGGTFSGELFTEGAATVAHGRVQASTFKSGNNYFSLYAKYATLQYFSLSIDGTATICAKFDLVNGTVIHQSNVVATITPDVDGWYRLSIQYSPTTDGNCSPQFWTEVTGSASFNRTHAVTTPVSVYLKKAAFSQGVLQDYFPTTTRFNVPALDYTNDTCPALSLETARTNLFLQSEDLSHADWIKGASPTITVNDIAAPDGLSTADKIAATAASGVIIQTRSLTVGATHTTSFYVKKGTHNYVYIRYTSGTAENFVSQVFDLSDGSLGELKVGTSSGTLVSATTQQVLDENEVFTGWYRVILIASHNIASGNVGIGFAGAKTGNIWNTSGTVTSGVFTGAETIYVWGAQLEAGSYVTSYIPTTTGTVGRIADAVSGLIPQKTNIALHSESLDNAVWNKDGVTITTNATTAPNGQITADKLVETATGPVQHRTYQSIATTPGKTYTYSVYVKAAERTQLFIQETADSGLAVFDLSTLAITGAAASKAVIVSVGDGWYRCSLYWTAQDASAVCQIGLGIGSAYTGDGTSGIYVWGAQLEAGSIATTYLSTTTTPIHDGSVIGQTEGTLYFEGIPFETATNKQIAISDGGANNRVVIAFNASGQLQGYIAFNGVGTLSPIVAHTVGINYKCAVTYRNNYGAFFVNGVKIGQSLTVVVPTCSRFGFDTGSGSTPFYGDVKGAKLFTTALTDAEAIALTTP